MAFIDIQNLQKTYRNDADCIYALRQVDLQIEEGIFLGIMGPSGSGKSTLLSILGGLCHPSEGNLLIDDIDIYQQI